jgi:hypothetical protein
VDAWLQVEEYGMRVQTIQNDPRRTSQRYILLKRNEKKPLEKGWQSTAYSRTDPELLAHLEAGGNLGLLCGNGLIVVDLDEHDPSASGTASWAAWCAHHGDDPAAYRPSTITPSGGRHIYFSVPPCLHIQNRVGIRPGIDIKGDGGYVVVPPSRLPSGEYVDAGGPVYEAPAWLIEEISAKQSEADVLDDGVALESATSEIKQVSRLEAFTADEALDKLARLYRDRTYWQAVWFDRLLPEGKTPSQRDIHVAYWLFRCGFSNEEVEAILSACPAVAQRPIHQGRQQKPWGRPSYRRVTLEKARKLALKHAAMLASRAAGNKSETEAILAQDEVYQALTEISGIRKYAIDARVAMRVREIQLRTGRAAENKPVTVSWSMLPVSRGTLRKHKPSENRFLETISISRRPGIASSYRLNIAAIQRKGGREGTKHSTPMCI